MGPQFLLDGMLGALTRWLRICGYDAAYLRNASDEELIRKAFDERRILLTRDGLLCRKAVRAGVEAFFIEGNGDAEKLASVSRRFHLELDPEKSRCPQCNATLVAVEKEAVEGKVPSRTLEAYDEFLLCDSCGKVYWKGSHWRNIMEMVEEAVKRASAIGDSKNTL